MCQIAKFVCACALFLLLIAFISVDGRGFDGGGDGKNVQFKKLLVKRAGEQPLSTTPKTSQNVTKKPDIMVNITKSREPQFIRKSKQENTDLVYSTDGTCGVRFEFGVFGFLDGAKEKKLLVQWNEHIWKNMRLLP